MSHFTTELTLECDVQSKLISRGRPASGPTYDCGGQPAEGAEYDIQVHFNGHDITGLLTDEQMEEVRNRVYEDEDGDLDEPNDDYDDAD